MQRCRAGSAVFEIGMREAFRIGRIGRRSFIFHKSCWRQGEYGTPQVMWLWGCAPIETNDACLDISPKGDVSRGLGRVRLSVR